MAIDPSNPGYQADFLSVMGEALLTRGLSVRTTNGFDGHSLETRGLVWGIYDIWLDTISIDSITTSWTNSDPVITTIWTDS